MFFLAGIIDEILPDSIGEELELEPKDKLLAINGRELEDIIDYRFFSADEHLELKIEKPDGQIWVCQVEKDEDEDLGLVFKADVFDQIRSCRNHCIFCFIDQLPAKPRPSLLIKDDDYRMSFLEGNFITGTNLTRRDIQRIIRLALSPLYISIHATDPLLRGRLLGRREAPVLPLLRQLLAAGIELHGQIVICPGINDGQALAATLADLAMLNPGLASLALVPVGLTRYQKNPKLRLFTKEEARLLLNYVQPLQEKYLRETGSAWLYPADEFYLLAEEPFPAAEHYDDFSQLENGVGLSAYFISQWQEKYQNLPINLETKRQVGLITGRAGEKIIAPLLKDLQDIRDLQVNLYAIENTFFGSEVTVSGLLTGSCLKTALAGCHLPPEILLPSSMLKFAEEIFLDGMTVSQLAAALGVKIQVVPVDGGELLTNIVRN